VDGKQKVFISRNFFKSTFSVYITRYFGKVAGVLGSINNEKFDDMTKSDNTITTFEDDFVDSWKLPTTCPNIESYSKSSSIAVNPTLKKNCDFLFKQKTSYFATCFAVVDPDSFYNICLKLISSLDHNSSENLQKAACTSGISYIEACSIESIPLRLPDTCIQ
jgi:C8 domain